MADARFLIRPIDPADSSELDFVGAGMLKTLIEVEGPAGGTLYTPEWLRDRAAFHLDPARSTGAIFVATGPDGALCAHTIVRIEQHPDGRPYGLFTTTWVEPIARRHGLADRLLERGQAWMREHALAESATWTSSTNAPLIALYAKHGYAQTDSGPNDLTGTLMVRLGRGLRF